MNREFQQSEFIKKKEPSENPIVNILLSYFIKIKRFNFA